MNILLFTIKTFDLSFSVLSILFSLNNYLGCQLPSTANSWYISNITGTEKQNIMHGLVLAVWKVCLEWLFSPLQVPCSRKHIAITSLPAHCHMTTYTRSHPSHLIHHPAVCIAHLSSTHPSSGTCMSITVTSSIVLCANARQHRQHCSVVNVCDAPAEGRGGGGIVVST